MLNIEKLREHDLVSIFSIHLSWYFCYEKITRVSNVKREMREKWDMKERRVLEYKSLAV